MSIDYHKALTDDGGAISTEITSGTLSEIIPNITKDNQTAGIVIHRKFYLKNTLAISRDVTITLDSGTPFTTILFEGSSDAEVVGDLTGSEVNESPIDVTITSGSHTSFWVQITVPASSTETTNYQKIVTEIEY